MRVTVLLSSLMLVAAVSAGAATPASSTESVIRQVAPVATPTLVPVCPRGTCY